MDRILVTGGTGFVGTWMQRTQPDNAIAMYLDRYAYKGYWPEVEYVVHLAPVDPWRAIAHALHSNARLLYCSSGIVYHPENDTEYRRNKIEWEKLCLGTVDNCVIARLFTFCGEHLTPDHAIVAFEQAAQARKPLHIWGDGSCVRSYMSGEELGRWMWAILLHGESGQAYDVGSDKPVTMLELAKRYSDNIIIEGGKDPMPVYLPPDTAKTRRLLHDCNATPPE